MPPKFRATWVNQQEKPQSVVQFVRLILGFCLVDFEFGKGQVGYLLLYMPIVPHFDTPLLDEKVGYVVKSYVQEVIVKPIIINGFEQI